MPRSGLALLPAVALLLAACSSGTGPTTTPSSPAATATSGSGSGSAATRIEVRLTDALKMEPANIRVPAGVPVTFVVTNAGSIEHEFFVGDEAAQSEHEKEMQAMGGMRHDEAMGIGLKPGERKELTVTMPKGMIFAGCHVAGHYAAGMRANIQID